MITPTQQLSLDLITKYLDEVDDQTFLDDYHKVEKGNGPTVDEYLKLMDNTSIS